MGDVVRALAASVRQLHRIAAERVMDPLTISAASGLRVRMESLEMLANNLANADTTGYKIDREFYSLYVSPEAQDPLAPAGSWRSRT